MAHPADLPMKLSERKSVRVNDSGEIRHHTGQNSSAKLSDEWDGVGGFNPKRSLGILPCITDLSLRTYKR